MTVIHCKIKLGEIPLHLYSILSGFILLQKKGLVELEWERLKRNSPRLPYNMIEVVLDHEYKILYDLNDGYDNLLDSNESYVDFYNGLLRGVDLCFKRSFDSNRNLYLDEKHKLLPLGLNYMATTKGNKAHIPTPQDSTKEKIKKWIRFLPLSTHYNGLYEIPTFEADPKKEEWPQVLFMARLWDDHGNYADQLSVGKREERAQINDSRVNCIRLLRKELGSRFVGGLTSSPFANQYYSELVIDKKTTSRNQYLKLVKASSICITTVGLHQSIGWKFAEYVAASRSIVTEEMTYELPGDIQKGKHYLTFKTAEECVNEVYRLIENPEFRYSMMKNNQTYYQNHVRPDAQIWNSLLIVRETFSELRFKKIGDHFL